MSTKSDSRSSLRDIARRAMIERGLLPDFSPQALAELDEIHGPVTRATEPTRDLKHLIWCSIDNDDSRDLDQLTVAEELADGIIVPRSVPFVYGGLQRGGRARRNPAHASGG